jgi:metal-responsive CopG/Arc/MetJ family transcriptional regulator
MIKVKSAAGTAVDELVIFSICIPRSVVKEIDQARAEYETSRSRWIKLAVVKELDRQKKKEKEGEYEDE